MIKGFGTEAIRLRITFPQINFSEADWPVALRKVENIEVGGSDNIFNFVIVVAGSRLPPTVQLFLDEICGMI